MAYTKLFSSIVTSTIWTEDDRTRIVWITMLALADKNGEVQGSVPGLARIAGVPVDDCRKALEKFLAPDPDSRTKDDEGRRIEVIDGGWHLLNYRKYREMASREEAKEAEAKRKARYRAKLARNNAEMSHDVPDKSQNVPETLHIAEAEAEAEAKNTLLLRPETESAPPLKATRARHVSQDAIKWTRETKWSGITEQDRNDWKAAFPACDIDRQLASMDAWLAANPAKAKKSNWRKFVTTWLTRSQDRGGDIGSNKPRANGCL